MIREIGRALPNDLGDPLLNTWILGWDADRIANGLRDFWAAPVFYPYQNALAYSEHLLGIAVFTAPVQWLTGNPVLAYNVAFLFSYVLAGTGMYLLTSSLTKSRAAAVVASVAFAFLPFRADHLPHIQVLMHGWMPVGLWALHRYFTLGSRTSLLAFVMAFLIQGLSNGYFLYYFSLPVAIVVIFELVRGRLPRLRVATDMALVASLVLITFAPVALAYYEVRWDQNLTRSRAEMIRFAADITSYSHVAPSLSLWGDVLSDGRPEAKLFPGFGLIALSTVGLAVAVVRRPRLNADGRLSARAIAGVYATIALSAFVLSLGPEPTAWGETLMSSGPYDWLLKVIPGLDGLRAISRIAVVVYLGLAVLAALGVRFILDWLPRRAGLIACVMLTGVVLAEGYRPMPYVNFEVQAGPDDDQAYAWLRESPPGAVLELPFIGAEPMNTARFMYRTLQHKHPIVNGRSGYLSPLVHFLRNAASPIHNPERLAEVLPVFRALGVQYIVVHESQFANQQHARLTLEALRGSRDQLFRIAEFGTTTVFWLAEWHAPPLTDITNLTRIARSEFQVTASHMPQRLEFAFDGDLDTRWLSGQQQTGHEWIEIQFDRPRDLGKVYIEIARRSLGDYPRELLVEVADDGTNFQTLYRGAGMLELMQGFLRDEHRAPIDIRLPPNRTSTLRLRQTGQAAPWYWSIHELTLWER